MKSLWRWILSWFKKEDKPKNEFPDNLIWLGINVKDWDITAKCTPSVAGNIVNMEYDKKGVWPTAGRVDGGTVANCWIVFTYSDGKTYAATWEWLKPNQTKKVLTGKLGSYIKRAPISPTWHPKSGEKIGLFVSGLCRDSSRNVSERSKLVWINWP